MYYITFSNYSYWRTSVCVLSTDFCLLICWHLSSMSTEGQCMCTYYCFTITDMSECALSLSCSSVIMYYCHHLAPEQPCLMYCCLALEQNYYIQWQHYNTLVLQRLYVFENNVSIFKPPLLVFEQTHLWGLMQTCRKLAMIWWLETLPSYDFQVSIRWLFSVVYAQSHGRHL